MIGDEIRYHADYKEISDMVIENFKNQLVKGNRICIAVGGESGCGKTSLAHALQVDLEMAIGIKGYLFHLDDYFKLPPKDNHNARLKDISKVGINEVELDLLDEHLLQFKNGNTVIEKPLVNYQENSIEIEKVNPKDYQFCIVEGTFSMLFNTPDYKIFIKKTYLDTKIARTKRGRDILDDFSEKVLEIEHNMIKYQVEYADYSFNNDFLDLK